MSLGKNVKRSVTYQFELNNSKILAPVSRYKGYSKLYQLNLSKMLLKCPDSPFIRKDNPSDNPEQLLIVSTQKFHPQQKQSHNNFPIKCQSNIPKCKVQTLKRSIKDRLINEDLAGSKQTIYFKGQGNQDKTTIASPENLQNYLDFSPLPDNCSARSSIKVNKNQFFRVTRKKMIQLTVINCEEKLCLEKEEDISKKESEIVNQVEKAQSSTLSEKKQQIKRKMSFNAHRQILKRTKLSKKILLPQIKPTPQKTVPHTYNISSKSNIPVLFRDPQQLKHIRAEAYAIIEYPTGNLIISNKGSNQYEIASLTKIMTYYTVMKIVGKYRVSIRDETVRVTDVAMDMTGTSAEILSGEVYTVEELLFGMMLPSGNDAATALAEWGGKILLKNHHNPQLHLHPVPHPSPNSQQCPQQPLQPTTTKSRLKAFIAQMNLNSKQLGLSSTRFANQHGLPNSESKSTAIDVCRLCFQCLKDQFFCKVVGSHSFKCMPYQAGNGDLRRNVEWINTNKLLRREGFVGVKTGITVTAGPCLASAYKFRDKTYICVVLRATKVSRRFKQTRKLIAWSLQKLYKQSLSSEQTKTLNNLKKNKPDLDSDYSQDEQEFNYDQMNRAQLKKRNNIINYQM